MVCQMAHRIKITYLPPKALWENCSVPEMEARIHWSLETKGHCHQKDMKNVRR